MKWSFLAPYINIPTSLRCVPPALARPTARPTARSLTHSLTHSLTQSINQSLTHSQPTNQSINQPTNQPKITIVPIYKCQLTFINSFRYSHIHKRIKRDLHSMTQLLLHSFIHLHNLTYSLTHLISHTSDRTHTKSPTHSFTQTLACLLNYSHLRSIHTFFPFIHTFIQSLIS